MGSLDAPMYVHQAVARRRLGFAGVTPVQAKRGGRGGDIHRVAVAHPSLHMRFSHSALDPPVGNDVPLTHPVGTGPWRGPPAAWTRPWPSP